MIDTVPRATPKQPNSQAARRGALALANCSTTFKVGDIVEATAKIRRRDGGSELKPFDRATVRSVWQTTSESPQIIGLEINGKLPMGDIVCFENVPLRLIYSPNDKLTP